MNVSIEYRHKIVKIQLLVSFCLGTVFPSFAQKEEFKLIITPTAVHAIAQSLKLKQIYPDSTQLQTNLHAFIEQLHHQGYFSANLDALSYQASSQSFNASVHLGKRYTRCAIRRGNVNEKDWRRLTPQDTLYTLDEWLTLQKDFLTFQENAGYPFASIQLDSFIHDQTPISAAVQARLGPYITFDSLIISGEAKLHAGSLAHQIGWEIGKPYREKKAQAAIRFLQQAAYIQLKAPPQILFRYDRAYLKLETLPVKNTQLDGIIGLLLSDQANTGRRPVITGTVDLKLQNPFGKGKILQFAFQRLRLGAQLFELNYEHPDLLKTHLTLQANFYSLREDSLFNNLRRSLALAHRNTWGELAFQVSIIDSRLTLSGQQLSSENLQRFGSNQITAYGLNYTFSQLDYNNVPRKGFEMSSKLLIGNKTIRPSIPSTDSLFESVYGGVDLKSLQGTLQLSLGKFWKVGKSSTIYSKLSGGKLFNQQLYQNDLFRIGGIQTLRGFNENAFFVSFYTIASLEYRIYFDRTSYFFTFFDQAFLENEVVDFSFSDQPYGLGLGLAVQTKGGLFRLIYSLGNSADQAIGFRQAKIHFGLTSFL
ncbi:MAG: hypothetical protein ACPGJS_06720 [Flammeovirgaceae bacterium]